MRISDWSSDVCSSDLNPNTYKKPHLPIDFARRLAAVFAEHGIEPADVMKLAGLSDDEAEPEARVIEASRPAVHYVSLPVALPSEAAIAEIGRGSGRARVWQSVWIAVVADPIKKTKQCKKNKQKY